MSFGGGEHEPDEWKELDEWIGKEDKEDDMSKFLIDEGEMGAWCANLPVASRTTTPDFFVDVMETENGITHVTENSLILPPPFQFQNNPDEMDEEVERWLQEFQIKSVTPTPTADAMKMKQKMGADDTNRMRMENALDVPSSSRQDKDRRVRESRNYHERVCKSIIIYG